MHGCMMTFTGRDEDLALSFFRFFFFAIRIRSTPRNGSRLTTWTERGGDRKEGHRRKSTSIPRTNLHLLRTIMHALGVFRVRPAPDCNQVKMDCFTSVRTWTHDAADTA